MPPEMHFESPLDLKEAFWTFQLSRIQEELYQYLMQDTDKCSDLMQQLKKDIKADKKLWSDMEIAFVLTSGEIQSVASDKISHSRVY